jgi:gamma-glutamyltranspeptidase/glutathione hydrolase
MRSTLVVALVALFGCKHEASGPVISASGSGSGSGSAKPAAEPVYRTAGSAWEIDASVTGVGKTYMVVSESTQASAVGREVLAHGGNAVDAVVATAFALEVTHPSAGNITGGGFAIVHVAAGSDVALDFRETAPAAATTDMYLDGSGKPTKDSVLGDRAVGTPGSVAGLFELHAKYGKKPWAELVAPAVALARDGFTIEPSQAAGLAHDADNLAKNPASAAIWLPAGKPLAVGTKLAIPELAVVLQRIADHGAEGFYTGETAKLIVDEMKRGGGILTSADLAGYKAVWRAPLVVDYRGYKLVAMPPPSSGGVVLALTANMFRNVDVAKLGWHTPAHIHMLVEVWRRAFAARNELLGDPAFVTGMPMDRLMSTAYADQLAATITPSATPSKAVSQLIEGTHTTNLTVVDAGGMAVALTTTLNGGFGNGVTVPGGGFLLNNEMDDFTAKPGTPNMFGLVQGSANKIEPGKRMLSSMSPTIALDDHGRIFAAAGAGGGPRIITAVWQTLSNLIDFHLALDAAVAAPRIHHQHLPDKVFIERKSLDKPTADELGAMDYKLDWSNPPFAFAGITAVARTPTGWAGTADPRRGGAAMGDSP